MRNDGVKHFRVLEKLKPGAQWTLRGPEVKWEQRLDEETNEPTGEWFSPNLEWSDANIPAPTKEEFETALAAAETEYASTEYQRMRQPEYPPLADLADALYWQSQGDNSKMEAYVAAVAAVKDKYPKNA